MTQLHVTVFISSVSHFRQRRQNMSLMLVWEWFQTSSSVSHMLRTSSANLPPLLSSFTPHASLGCYSYLFMQSAPLSMNENELNNIKHDFCFLFCFIFSLIPRQDERCYAQSDISWNSHACVSDTPRWSFVIPS